MINCNLQRLDGPVRGNGKIVQELEAFFRGAGWNVIKVLWGREWDPLFARDTTGELVRIMNETPDGDFQTYKGESGSYVRDNFFGKSAATKLMVKDMTDDQIWKMKRGGHDYRKVYAAYHAATLRDGRPTVVLAKTVKGYGLGHNFEARNATHQMKKLTIEDLKQFRDHLRHPDHRRADRQEPVRGALLPPGRGLRGDPVHPRAAPQARRLHARAAQHPEAAGAAGRRGLRRGQEGLRQADGGHHHGLRPASCAT